MRWYSRYSRINEKLKELEATHVEVTPYHYKEVRRVELFFYVLSTFARELAL